MQVEAFIFLMNIFDDQLTTRSNFLVLENHARSDSSGGTNDEPKPHLDEAVNTSSSASTPGRLFDCDADVGKSYYKYINKVAVLSPYPPHAQEFVKGALGTFGTLTQT